jgi:hypothetical protein
MTGDPLAEKETLPQGDDDPNLTYIAVGRAIHSWEGMEQALAYLFLTLSGIHDHPSNLAAYGAKHRKFIDRLSAVKAAAEAYFMKSPDQQIEGTFSGLVAEIEALAIERHRIAHGHISIVAEWKLPENVTGKIAITSRAKYRWAAPFYSTTQLRTDPFGIGSKDIDRLTDEFMRLHNNVHAFTTSLTSPPLP